MKAIESLNEWKDWLKEHPNSGLLMYKSGSEISECAFGKLAGLETKLALAYVDVSQVRDVHPQYQITSAPSLLLFEQAQMTQVVKGCMDEDYYKALFEKSLFTASGVEGKKQNRVILYSTPTCSWCNTIKGYFRKRQVAYREIDVSKDEKALQEMVRKSGQQGVPQTDINGQVVVGFDQKKIDQLLGLN